MSDEKPNSAKGRDSYDSTSTGTVVHFLNRNVTPYATSTLGPKFDLVPVEKHKDIMINVARLHAKQEYDRIMELVAVLQKQADQIKHRLDLTDMVHSATYNFKLTNGKSYWLIYDHHKQTTILSMTGPHDWSSSAPEGYEYITKIKWLGDHSWIESDD